jgi:GH15 family glucan-1,4-alpha-glucosidase
MREHLYSTADQRFLRGLLSSGDDQLVPDPIIDSSLFGSFYFGCFAPDDPMIVSTMAAVETSLLNRTRYGGVARFENDDYMRGPNGAPPNSWIITTLWLAEYYIAGAVTRDDLAKALAILEWTAERSLSSGVLPEQIDPLTGEHRSVSPLTWSHSTFVATVQSYLSRLAALS